MPVILFLKILGGMAALALGIFLGGGRYTQSQEEIEYRLGGGKPRRSKRHFMWLDMLRTDQRGSDRRRTRAHFQRSVASKRSSLPALGRSAQNEGKDHLVQDHQGYPDQTAK